MVLGMAHGSGRERGRKWWKLSNTFKVRRTFIPQTVDICISYINTYIIYKYIYWEKHVHSKSSSSSGAMQSVLVTFAFLPWKYLEETTRVGQYILYACLRLLWCVLSRNQGRVLGLWREEGVAKTVTCLNQDPSPSPQRPTPSDLTPARPHYWRPHVSPNYSISQVTTIQNICM